ncbi:kinase-like domain-containing protein [Tanacetum coccineum]
MSSTNHDDLAYLKIPLQNILSATNNFAAENFCGEGGFGNHYQGQLLWYGELTDIHAQRWSKEWNEKEQQFWMEISMLSTLKHKNLVSFVGFRWSCGSKVTGETQVNSGNFGDFPFAEFRLSMKIKASQRHVSFDTSNVSNRLGYTDPTYLETKSAHHKSDMYSFGIVMFELLCGRKALIDDDQDNMNLAPLAITHFTEKTLPEIIDWDLWKQMDLQSLKLFTETAFECLNDERSQRPNVDEIVTRLKKALEIQLERQNAVRLFFHFIF